MPQWSWNGELTEGRMTEQLEQFAAQGAGGLFAHARACQIDLLLRLHGEQVDFDLSDESVLEEIGRIENDRLVVGEQAYEAVVFPPGRENGPLRRWPC